MTERNKKKSRKFLGSRSWGVGNIKNNRGKGSRGGVGKGGIKHKWSYNVVYARETLGSTGFKPWKPKRLEEIDLSGISKEIPSGEKPTIEKRGFKVLSSGILIKPAIIRASAFSKKAEEKIKSAGGEAVKL